MITTRGGKRRATSSKSRPGKRSKQAQEMQVEAPRKRDFAADMDVDSDSNSSDAMGIATKPAYELELLAYKDLAQVSMVHAKNMDYASIYPMNV